MNTKNLSAQDEWTYDQFITFLLIHASYADLEFTESERQAILDKVNLETFQEVNEFYDKLGEYECLDFIMKHKDQFIPNEQEKLKVMNTLSEHFYADGTVSKLELLLLDFLDRLITFN